MAANLADDTGLLVTVCIVSVTGFFFLCFVVLSVACSLYPNVCHKRKSLGKFRGRVCSFRGGGGEALEGSLSAFKHSSSLGADFFFTVRRTRDGEIIVYPDETLKRCCGTPWKITDSLYRVLPWLRPPFFLRYQKGFASRGRPEPIPTLSEIFERFPKSAVFINVKCDDVDHALIDGIAKLVVKHKRETTTAWGSHNTKLINALYNKNPFIPLWVNRHRRYLFLVLFYLGLLPFTPIRETVFLTPMPLLMLDPQRGFQVGYLRGWKTWIIDKLMMSSGLFKHLKARGIPTYVYCLNEPHEFDRAFQLGATGVITDFPSRLKDHLDRLDAEKKDREME
ncbi:lysophospholipase D GDPD1-like [Haliotis rubra]|uniref:lysophospholipase D GDPD1-like n=1 Tax=Haliotis rubra TaxID=36100 RepID=UPI001EE51B3B|nr:lysophospholipase D GDPD1-like [Haliotis rubra]